MRWMTDRDAWINELIANPTLTPEDKLTCIAVSKYMTDYSGGWVDHVRIADETGLSGDEVLVSLRRLDGFLWSIGREPRR
jgi:hypothetical protein